MGRLERSMNAKQYAMYQEMMQADKQIPEGAIKMERSKWATVQKMVKEQAHKHFNTEEELAQFLKKNPQYTVNQRFGHHTQMINVELYAHGYADTTLNHYGYRVPSRWLTDQEVEEYLQYVEDQKK